MYREFYTGREFQMKIPLKVTIEASLCIALSTALSYLKLFTMPQGGSVSLAMLPIFVFALRRGGVYGLVAGAVTGLIHLLLGGYVVHPLQALLDYPMAYAALGLSGFFGANKIAGTAVGAMANLACAVASGVIFFSSYAPAGTNVWVYSLVYNASAVIPEAVISTILVYAVWPRINKI